MDLSHLEFLHPKAPTERRDELLAQLPGILASLDGCLRAAELRWPKQAELDQLNSAVEELCREHGREIRRAGGRGVEWRDYKFANGRRKAFHLCPILKRLLLRVEQVPERPLLYLMDLAGGRGELAKLATEFIGLWMILIDGTEHGTAVRAAVTWDRFLPLFLEPGETLPELDANRGRAGTKLLGSPGAVCYIRYLELYQEDVCWRKGIGAGAIDFHSWGRGVFPSQDQDCVFKPLQRILRVPSRLLKWSPHRPDRAAEERSEKGCVMARNRQARARERKTAQNSVTDLGASPS